MDAPENHRIQMKRIITNSLVKVQLEGTCSTLSYTLYRIVLDGDEPEEIRDLAADNEQLICKFILRAWSLENFFSVKNGSRFKFMSVWERHNRMGFNEYYHDEMYEMETQNEANYSRYMDYLSNKFWEANK